MEFRIGQLEPPIGLLNVGSYLLMLQPRTENHTMDENALRSDENNIKARQSHRT